MTRLFILLSFIIYSTTGFSQIKLINKDSPVEDKFKTITIDNTVSNLKLNQTIEEGETVGTIAPKPAKLSQGFNQQLEQSIAYYQSRNFAKAASVLQVAVVKEPTNPFLLEAYARALYQIDSKKGESYKVYKKLVSMLDEKATSHDELFVDPWFMEAYWKLGTLHMDNGKWKEAMLEIGKFMLMASKMKDQPIYEQALSYLTECAFEMKDKTLCEHFSKRTLEINPNNEYIEEYRLN